MILAKWDEIGKHFFETGVDRGMLYQYNKEDSSFGAGVPWSGLTTVTESPSGAEANDQYADNIKYLSLRSAEDFGGTIEAFYYPDEFGQNDGTAEPVPGVTITQQTRKAFGFSYRSLLGNDTEQTDYGYKIHLVYNATCNPSEKSHSTVNDSPEAAAFSWEFTTIPVDVGTIDGVAYKKTSHLVIDTSKFVTTAEKARLAAFEEIIYGKAAEGANPAIEARLPLPAEVLTLLGATTTGSVTFAQHSVTVAENGTVNLAVVVEPDDAVITWTSDDTANATVADGVVTGVAEGSANITASITINDQVYSDSCHVVVTAE